MPARFWGEPLGAMFVVFGVAGSIAACISLLGRVGRPRRHVARVESVRLLGEPRNDAPLELVCAMSAEWKGHRPGQFVYAAFDAWEGAHPFTIASAPEALGKTGNGEPLLRLVIKPLGDFTDTLAGRLHAGQSVTIEGPYGRFDAKGSARRQQVWVAAGVGITPFLALLEARQPSAQTSAHALGKRQGAEVEMHYCTRNAASDALLERVQQLCAQAQPPVHLTVHDEASGHLFTPQALAVDRKRPSDIWFCGPRGLGAVLRSACRSIGRGRWHLHHELFSMR
ncbi:Dihydroorotate dehydrogenase B (NAD(+)), electron transfer subunit [bioreactor metagenome]|uniref:Dihydroorotate dehydrogenase B (NAD(+)), electron transfer subunit n=1 Tax=bioreactor metagenome TaxID=1076179 RepID=A0A645FBI8_9ZZZZ